MRGLRSWRPALVMAWRDARRSRARSILVLVMIALPVLGVTAADVIMQTSDVSGAEALDRRLGAADALITAEAGLTRVYQSFDPEDASGWSGSRRADPATLADVEAALGREVRAIEHHEGSVRFTTDSGVGQLEATEMDLGDPMATGLFELTSGRMPETPGEVLVNDDLAARGPGPGEQLELANGTTRTIVGTAESTSFRGHPLAFGPIGAFGLKERRGRVQTWLVEAGPVSWSEVRELNASGFSVLSRAVLEDPPPRSEIPAEIRYASGTDDALIAVIALVAVMALIEVVLLAGPAFAVGARRQSRNLALLAASGGTPRQARRVVLASGIVLGGMGAGLGVVLGIVGAWAAMPLVQHFSTSMLGPFEVPWLHVAGIAAFGLVSAFLAAVVPAWIASRQDVVAVLGGRRGDRAASRKSPVLGLLVLGAGVAGAVHGARVGSMGEYYIAGSAILAVLGMVLLIPTVVVVLAKLSRRLPLTLRYAIRDAARHRTRTVPAVAAVAATVCGVVALGIANASDEAQNEATYTAELPMGQASVVDYRRKADWPAMRDVVERGLPQARVREVRGLDADNRTELYFKVHGHRSLLTGYSSSLGSSVLVSDDKVPIILPGVSNAEIAAAERMLARGGAVVLTSKPVRADEVQVSGQRWGPRSERPQRLGRETVPATFVQVDGEYAMAQAVVAPHALAGLGLSPRTVGLVVDGAEISRAQERDVSEALGAISRQASFYVERGYQPGNEAVLLLLVLGALGAVLMLGGTLTATFLALSDARPDLGTLSAVGASPRRRRGVAAAYALVVGFVGAALGAAVGFVPGVAVTYPLTGMSGGGGHAGPFLDVPWLLIGTLVVALPLFTAAIVGLTARSRLPMVARLD